MKVTNLAGTKSILAWAESAKSGSAKKALVILACRSSAKNVIKLFFFVFLNEENLQN
jgi:hypothetical protein